MLEIVTFGMIRLKLAYPAKYLTTKFSELSGDDYSDQLTGKKINWGGIRRPPWRFSAVVASFVARTKLLNVEPG